MAERLLDRLEDCKRTFPRVAVLGGAGEAVVSRLCGGRAGIESAVLLDSSHAMLQRCRQRVNISVLGPDVMRIKQKSGCPQSMRAGGHTMLKALTLRCSLHDRMRRLLFGSSIDMCCADLPTERV